MSDRWPSGPIPARPHPDGAKWYSPDPQSGCIELVWGTYFMTAKGADGERWPVGRAESLEDCQLYAERFLGIARDSWTRVVEA